MKIKNLFLPLMAVCVGLSSL